jgi:hypothetical protein
MATRKPLVVVAGQVQQLQPADTVDDPKIGTYAPGAFTVAAGQYAIMSKRLTLTTTQRVTLASDSRLRID